MLSDQEQKEIVDLISNNKTHEKGTTLLEQAFLKEFHVATIRNDKENEIWLYKEGIYVPNGISYIQEFCKRILGKKYSSSIAHQVVSKIVPETYVDAEEFFQVNTPSRYVPLLNGILDLENEEVLPYSLDFKFFNKIPVEFDKNASCPEFMRFLQSTVEKEDISIIQELFGYVLLREYKIPKAVLLLGSGRNGKSTLLEIMRRFIGIENCSSQSLQELCNNTFSLIELHNKYINICGDMNSATVKNEGTFKQLTGQDLLQANRKHQSMIKFVNYAKLVFSANRPPRIEEGGEAFFSRWIILNFPHRFYTEKEIKAMEKAGEMVSDVKLVNRNIVENIIPKECAGILNWALEGQKRLLANKNFSNSKIASQIEEEYLMKSDSFRYFAKEKLEACEYEEYIIKSELKEKYTAFCKEKHIPAVSDKEIKRVLYDDFCVSERQMATIGSKMTWIGVRFKAEDKTDQKDKRMFEFEPKEEK